MIRDELKKIGLIVDVVPLDANAVFRNFASGAYDAMYHDIYPSDTDPALTPDFWLSAGSFHMWNPAQKAPRLPGNSGSTT